MKGLEEGVPVRAAIALAVPANFALAAVDTIIREFAHYPAGTSLALNVQQLHVPFQGIISVPVQVHVGCGHGHNEWRLVIQAAANPHLYPTFEGVLCLLGAAREGSQLELTGAYTVPLGAFGRVLDRTVFRGAAESSLQRFIRDVASRAAALAKWAQVL